MRSLPKLQALSVRDGTAHPLVGAPPRA